MGCYFLLQRVFLTQGSNPGLLHSSQILYPLTHKGSPISDIKLGLPSKIFPQHWNHQYHSCIILKQNLLFFFQLLVVDTVKFMIWSYKSSYIWKWKWKSLSCCGLCDFMDYTVHRILQARMLEWVAFPFSRGSSQPRDQTQVSHVAGRFFTRWATREAQEYWSEYPIPSPVDFPDHPGIKPGSPAFQVDSLPTQLSGELCSDIWTKLKLYLRKSHDHFFFSERTNTRITMG